MIIMMCLNLLTSRLILQALGVDDYGIYNLVGGLVVFISIINAGMLTATQRFLNFGIGKDNIENLRTIFRTSCVIHLLLTLLIVLVSETIGLWFLHNKLQIPVKQMNVASWVFQWSVVTTSIQINTLPYNSTVIAHEKMSVFSVITVFQSLCSVGVAYLLLNISTGRLKLYAVLTCVVQFVVSISYIIYSLKNFKECTGRAKFDKGIFKEMIVFAGWCLVGSSAGLLYSQGLNVLLGMFFLPFVNAARGLAVTVQNAVNQVFNNVQNAVVPQLIQSFARGDKQYFFWLLINSSKYFSFLLLIFAIPIWIRTPYILNLWLGEIPQYTVIFIRILLGVSLIEAISGPLMRASDATGDIKKYHLVVGGVLLTIVPIAYVFLKFGYNPESVFYVYLVISFFALVARVLVLNQKIHLPIKLFLSKVIIPVLIVTLLSFILSIVLSRYFHNNFSGFLCFTLSSILATISVILIVGMDLEERRFIKTKIILLLKKEHD